MKKIVPILFFSLSLIACNQSKETKTTELESSINPKDPISLEESEMKEESSSLSIDFSQLITPEFFDNTTEGIGSTELKTLIETKESEFWSITDQSENSISFTCKIPSSQVFVQWINTTDNKPIFIALTNNEQASSLKLFSQSNDKINETNELLPEIKVDKFYNKNYLASMMVFEGINYNYFFSAHNEILIELNPGEHLEELGEPEFYLQLKWNGEQLDYIQIPVIQ